MSLGENVNAFIAAVTVSVLLVLTMLLFVFRKYKAGKMLWQRPRTRSGQPDSRSASTDPVAWATGRYDQALRELETAQKALAEDIRGVVDVLVEHAIGARARSGMDERLVTLFEIYEHAAQSIDSFVSAVQQLQPTVALLEPFGSENAVAEIIRDYEELAGIGDHLRQDSASLQRLQNCNELARRAAADFRVGNIPAHQYLRTVYEGTASSREQLPSIAEEQERLTRLAGSAEEQLLNWIDSVSELRNMAVAEARVELQDACSRLIGHADEIIQAWDIKLIDVKVGSTLYDSRLHDLGGTLPRSDVQPETIIGVRRLGHKRNGVVVRKPEVLVAAASAAV